MPNSAYFQGGYKVGPYHLLMEFWDQLGFWNHLVQISPYSYHLRMIRLQWFQWPNWGCNLGMWFRKKMGAFLRSFKTATWWANEAQLHGNEDRLAWVLVSFSGRTIFLGRVCSQRILGNFCSKWSCRWWFQRCFIFTPILGVSWSNLTSIFLPRRGEVILGGPSQLVSG